MGRPTKVRVDSPRPGRDRAGRPDQARYAGGRHAGSCATTVRWPEFADLAFSFLATGRAGMSRCILRPQPRLRRHSRCGGHGGLHPAPTEHSSATSQGERRHVPREQVEPLVAGMVHEDRQGAAAGSTGCGIGPADQQVVLRPGVRRRTPAGVSAAAVLRPDRRGLRLRSAQGQREREDDRRRLQLRWWRWTPAQSSSVVSAYDDAHRHPRGLRRRSERCAAGHTISPRARRSCATPPRLAGTVSDPADLQPGPATSGPPRPTDDVRTACSATARSTAVTLIMLAGASATWFAIPADGSADRLAQLAATR